MHPYVRAEHVEDEVGEGIEHECRLREARVGVHEPLTIAQPATRSKSPIASCRPAITANAVSRADSWAASSGTSLGTLPKGPAGVPSGASGPWPETNTRFPRIRTHSNEMVTPGGSFGLAGSVSPSSFRRVATLPATSA